MCALSIRSPGGLSDKKQRRCSLEILERTPKRYQDFVWWAWLEIVFHPKELRYKFRLTDTFIIYYSSKDDCFDTFYSLS